MVQRRVARLVLSQYHPQDSVTNMIEALWDTLDHRRAVARVLLLYKIVNGLVAIESGEYLCKPARKSRRVKTHTFKKTPNLTGYPFTLEQ